MANKQKKLISVLPVILSGGAGKRLWPLSKKDFPKQFHKLFDSLSMFQKTLKYFEKINSDKVSFGQGLILTGEEHRFLVLQQLNELAIDSFHIITEPALRNTAPALTLASIHALELAEDPVLLVLPSDHLISNLLEFQEKIQEAVQMASSGKIVILGIKPTYPEVDYGYIKTEKSEDDKLSLRVNKFIEKPALEIAKSFLKEKAYFWNSGIIIVKAKLWLEAINEFRPNIFENSTEAWRRKTQDNCFFKPCKDSFLKIESESIDYAVLENCFNSNFDIRMIPINVGWNDLGSWKKLAESLYKDSNNNSIFGNTLDIKTKNSFIYSSGKFLATLGLDNIIAIETKDLVLVANKDFADEIHNIINYFESDEKTEYSSSKENLRPWGSFELIEEGIGFKIKRIILNSKSSISLQMHNHRAEHWVVISGIANVICNEIEMVLYKNQSTFIKQGAIHRLINKQDYPLEIIEIQTGSILCEDDIVRIEDNYER